ncbi:hypothetical protein SKAU_G00235220 [Synaphobranchus kaupii]|uniref:Uncharacterized protein n=1 Tax=Synaphobranchus kaupii TaxID=118154 RepID=A0A9Q1ITS3_SYNKA|nr:hypothetical protein SKAU_G00235220 [Synaphobranchus kaupii]
MMGEEPRLLKTGGCLHFAALSFYCVGMFTSILGLRISCKPDVTDFNLHRFPVELRRRPIPGFIAPHQRLQSYTVRTRDGHVYRGSRRGSVDEDSQPQTDGNSTSVRRSARLAVRNPESPCIAFWSITKILGVLFSRNIQAPLGASHEELLHFLIANVPDIETAPATGIPASTPPAPRKASSKQKHCAPPATSSAVASAPAKRARSQSLGAIPQQTEDPILTALSNIQTSLLDMDAQILNLENSPSATSFVFNEPAIGAS